MGHGSTLPQTSETMYAFFGNAEVDLNYTADSHERLIRASKAITIFLCLVQREMHAYHFVKTNN